MPNSTPAPYKCSILKKAPTNNKANSARVLTPPQGEINRLTESIGTFVQTIEILVALGTRDHDLIGEGQFVESRQNRIKSVQYN